MKTGQSQEVRLEQLLGRIVVAGNNRPLGRLEEFHAKQRGDYYEIVEYMIGGAALVERLDVGVRTLFGKSTGGKIARWDQLDISDPEHPRLTCSVEELRENAV